MLRLEIGGEERERFAAFRYDTIQTTLQELKQQNERVSNLIVKVGGTLAAALLGLVITAITVLIKRGGV